MENRESGWISSTNNDNNNKYELQRRINFSFHKPILVRQNSLKYFPDPSKKLFLFYSWVFTNNIGFLSELYIGEHIYNKLRHISFKIFQIFVILSKGYSW